MYRFSFYVLICLSILSLFFFSHRVEASLTILHSFAGEEGQNPNGSLIESDGKFFGMATVGGNGYGVIFQYNPANVGNEYSVLHNFSGVDGAAPIGSLVEFNGKFYGLTSGGGSSGAGVIFQYDPSNMGNEYSVLHNFNGEDGSYPEGSLIIVGNKFYGLTTFGGSEGYGVLFQFDPSNSREGYSAVHNFTPTTGIHPNGSPVELNGKIYGAAREGGPSGAGILFQYDPSTNEYSVLHNFTADDGSYPGRSFLISNGKIYGLTFAGGANQAGIIFKYDPENVGNEFSVLHTFNNVDGGFPGGSLIQSGNEFYGMTEQGGSDGSGVIFKYNPQEAGEYEVLHNFQSASEGALSRGSLYESNGKFYGTLSTGGFYGNGAIFEFIPDQISPPPLTEIKPAPIRKPPVRTSPEEVAPSRSPNEIEPPPPIIPSNSSATITTPTIETPQTPPIQTTDQNNNPGESTPWYEKVIDFFAKIF